MDRYLSEGADLEAQNTDGWTPLHLAAEHSETPAVVKVLLDAGADPNTRNKSGRTPLHRAAVFSKTPEVVKVLLDAGADLEARNNNGHTPLQLAAANSETPEVVKVLLDAGADLDARDEDGHTPLHRAAVFSKTPSVVKVLLDAGADLSARTTEHEDTPLHLLYRPVDRFRKALDLVPDGFGGRHPDKGTGLRVVVLHEVIDFEGEWANTGEGTASNGLLGNDAEETFHLIDP